MARVFITGSADGLGRNAAEELLSAGHQVVVHARTGQRLQAIRALLDRGASGVVGDLADTAAVRELAGQVNALGVMDAVIHNAAVERGPTLVPVNIVAPYLLTALIERPRRLIYLSSGMHRGGRTELAAIDSSGGASSATYSDTKLFVTTLSAAVARLWPNVISSAVDPGWVPTRMGGRHAPDDLRLGHVTQVWLATSDDAHALTSGRYWHHQRRVRPHAAVADVRFQTALLDVLCRHTGVVLTQ